MEYFVPLSSIMIIVLKKGNEIFLKLKKTAIKKSYWLFETISFQQKSANFFFLKFARKSKICSRNFYISTSDCSYNTMKGKGDEK